MQFLLYNNCGWVHIHFLNSLTARDSWTETAAGLRELVEAYIAPRLSTHAPPADGAHTGRTVTMKSIGLDGHERQMQLAMKTCDGSIADRE